MQLNLCTCIGCCKRGFMNMDFKNMSQRFEYRSNGMIRKRKKSKASSAVDKVKKERFTFLSSGEYINTFSMFYIII